MKQKLLNILFISFILVSTFMTSYSKATVIPVGVQENVIYDDVINLWGWNLLYRDDYSANVTLDTMFAGHGDYIMLGAINGTSDTIQLLAAIAWTDFIVYTPQNVTKTVNGAQWYNNTGSIGFVGLGDTINQNSCDINNTNANLRLCWHADQGGYNDPATELIGGWRAGTATGLNSSTSWDRIVFTSNTVNPINVPEPTSIAILSLALIALGLRKKFK